MKRLSTCHCGGKIIQNGVGNVFCADCSDRNLDEKLSQWAKRKENHRELLCLRLSLKTQWFQMTKAGIKTEDYREINSYWIKRLTSDFSKGSMKPKKFDYNIMTLGYPKSGDTERIVKLEHKGIEIRTGNPEWGAEKDKLYFVIMHGNVTH